MCSYSLSSPRIKDVRFVPASDQQVDGRAMALVTASTIHSLNLWLVAIGLLELQINPLYNVCYLLRRSLCIAK